MFAHRIISAAIVLCVAVLGTGQMAYAAEPEVTMVITPVDRTVTTRVWTANTFFVIEDNFLKNEGVFILMQRNDNLESVVIDYQTPRVRQMVRYVDNGESTIVWDGVGWNPDTDIVSITINRKDLFRTHNPFEGYA